MNNIEILVLWLTIQLPNAYNRVNLENNAQYQVFDYQNTNSKNSLIRDDLFKFILSTYISELNA